MKTLKIFLAAAAFLCFGFSRSYGGVLTADKDTLALYHFDEFYGPVDGKMAWTKDSGPNGLDMCYVNLTNGPTEGKYGKAIEFDKTKKQKILCSFKDKFTRAYKDAEAITVELWFYPTGNLDYECLFCQVGFPNAGFMVNWGEQAPGKNAWLQMRKVDGMDWHRLQGKLDPELAFNAWHHFACTWDDKKAQVFIDGALIAYKDLGPGEEINLSPADFWVGCRNGNEWFFSGKIDELRISRVVRTPEEIAASADRTPVK